MPPEPRRSVVAAPEQPPARGGWLDHSPNRLGTGAEDTPPAVVVVAIQEAVEGGNLDLLQCYAVLRDGVFLPK
jgi:hypothetical protein